MGPKAFWGTVGVLLALAIALLVLPREDSGSKSGVLAATPDADREVPPGYYPPAPSEAVGMTPEWRRFADGIDRLCAQSFNFAIAVDARTQELAKLRGWSRARTEAAVVKVWAEQVATISLGATRAGAPPRRQRLFDRWRSNVAQRAALFNRASEEAGAGNFAVESRLLDRIHRLKARSDELGQRFGLRICTSN